MGWWPGYGGSGDWRAVLTAPPPPLAPPLKGEGCDGGQAGWGSPASSSTSRFGAGKTRARAAAAMPMAAEAM